MFLFYSRYSILDILEKHKDILMSIYFNIIFTDKEGWNKLDNAT